MVLAYRSLIGGAGELAQEEGVLIWGKRWREAHRQ
jgi:hypothetical protein